MPDGGRDLERGDSRQRSNPPYPNPGLRYSSSNNNDTNAAELTSPEPQFVSQLDISRLERQASCKNGR